MPTLREIAIVGGAIVLIALVIGGLFVAGTYNSLVNSDVSVENAKGNVQTAYQRRADLIPNLVNTVQGAATFEKSTQTEIAELRSQAGQVKTQVANAQTIDEMEAAGTQMGSILARLMLVVEAYPTLKSNENFKMLQDQLEGTENRIKYERDNYNAAVKDYQVKVRSFPSNIIAGMFGFNGDKWKMFEATEGAQVAPTVTFTF
jgi:LemA protein